MIDVEKILSELRMEAEKVAEQIDLDQRLEEGKALAEQAKERLQTDEKARWAAAGAGGLLLAGLLGSRGGRRFAGGVAKTGAVAALGALAYKAWQNRAAAEEIDPAEPAHAGYVASEADDGDFAAAVVRVMLAAAHADGRFDEAERLLIETELEKSGADAETRALLLSPIEESALMDEILPAIKSPNHAAQLYAAASVIARSGTQMEKDFLARFAERIGVDPRHALAIDRAGEDG
ncbi:MAG: DUF533 domain-containing protein [Pseudomonadota bacterium]